MSDDDGKADSKKEEEEEEGVQDVMLQACELRFKFTQLKQRNENEEADHVFKQLLEIFAKNNMTAFYLATCDDNNIPVDAQLADTWLANKKKLLEANDAKKALAESSEGDMEIHEVELERARILSLTSDLKSAVDNYLGIKNLTTGKQIDKYLSILRLCLAWGDDYAYKTHKAVTAKLIDKGGDWDRRNRFIVYNGVHNFRVRNFKDAAQSFLDCISTFTATEIFSYEQLVKYTIISSVLTLERVEIKEKLIDAPEIIQIIDEMTVFKSFLHSFYYCRYSEFFRSTIEVMNIFVRRNFYLCVHANFFLREIRLRAYSQFLQSYRSVKLESMANEFGLSVHFLDEELSSFIAVSKILCKIDKVNGIVQMARSDHRNVEYQEIIKKGDVLLNRLQRLSRIITY